MHQCKQWFRGAIQIVQLVPPMLLSCDFCSLHFLLHTLWPDHLTLGEGAGAVGGFGAWKVRTQFRKSGTAMRATTLLQVGVCVNPHTNPFHQATKNSVQTNNASTLITGVPRQLLWSLGGRGHFFADCQACSEVTATPLTIYHASLRGWTSENGAQTENEVVSFSPDPGPCSNRSPCDVHVAQVSVGMQTRVPVDCVQVRTVSTSFVFSNNSFLRS